MKLFQNSDGADASARAVLAILTGRHGLESSYDSDKGGYVAQPEIARWHNCREQGYVISLITANYTKQLNIAFFTHRNSDDICAVAWEQLTTNPPTIDTMNTKGLVYKHKWDVSHQLCYNKIVEMADWIYHRLNQFWLTNNTKAKETAVPA